MLGEIIKNNRFSFYKGFDNWEEAVEKACFPLIEDGAIDPPYVDAIIDNVKKYGPYIVIAPDICIPHAQEGSFVNETAISFMKTETPVKFGDGENESARLFFVLASKDNNIHIENLKKIVEILSDESAIEKMLKANCKEDII